MKKSCLVFVKLFAISLFFLFLPKAVFADCTRLISGSGVPPCTTKIFNPDCTVSSCYFDPSCVGDSTGTECANDTYGQNCTQENTTFGWYADRCDRTPVATETPTPPPLPNCNPGGSCGACVPREDGFDTEGNYVNYQNTCFANADKTYDPNLTS